MIEYPTGRARILPWREVVGRRRWFCLLEIFNGSRAYISSDNNLMDDLSHHNPCIERLHDDRDFKCHEFHILH